MKKGAVSGKGAGQFEREDRGERRSRAWLDCEASTPHDINSYIHTYYIDYIPYSTNVTGAARAHTTGEKMAGPRSSVATAASVAALLVTGGSAFVVPTPQVSRCVC